MGQLERLAFGNCQCQALESRHLDLDKADGMSNLTRLALSCRISDAASLPKLTNLVTLDLTRASGRHVTAPSHLLLL